MSDEQKKNQAITNEGKQDEVELNDLTVSEPEVEVLTSEDARAIPEGGASFGNDGCCTICSSSL